MSVRTPVPVAEARLGLIACCLAITMAGAAAGPLSDAIGDASCDADAQCRTVAVGHSACGGAAAWRAWSTQVSTPSTVASAVHAEDAQADAAAGPPGRRISTCAIVADPGAFCARAAQPAGAASASAPDGVCRLRQRGSAADPRPDR